MVKRKASVKNIEVKDPLYSANDYLAVYQEGEDLNFSVVKVLEEVFEESEFVQVLYFNRVKENQFSSHNKDEIKLKNVIQLIPAEQIKVKAQEVKKSTSRGRAASKSKDPKEAEVAKEELQVDPKFYKALKLSVAKFRPEETEAEEGSDESDQDEDQKDSKPKLETQPLKIRKIVGPAKSQKTKKRPKMEDGSGEEEESEDDEAPSKSIKKNNGAIQKVSAKPQHFVRGKGNPKVSVIEKCAQLESESLIPNYECSTRNSNREVIRAAKIKSKKLFDKLISSEYKLSRLTERWGVDNTTTALKIILRDNNEELLIPYLEHIVSNHGDKNKLKLGADNVVSLQKIDTGFNDKYAYGVATRQVTMSRGGRVGNNAFVEEEYYSPDLDEDHVEFMLSDSNVTLKTIQTILSYFPNIENQLIAKVNVALRFGRVAIAAYLMERSLKNGGYGLSEFYIPALTGTTLKGLEDIKKPSCTKKAFGLGNFSPIHCACLNPNVAVLKHLLTVNPEYLNLDEAMRKPVHYAACCDSAEPLKYLVSQQVDTREMDNQRTSPLMYASRAGKIECVKFLLQENRSIPNHKDRKGYNAIHYAAEHGHFEIVKLLVEKGGIKLDLPGPERKTSMHIAAAKGDFQMVDNLLKLGGKTIHKDKFKRTALLLAAKNGNLKVASLLLSRGAPFEEPDSSGNSPLHYACAYGYPEMIDLLIQAGANPNSMNSWKLSPTAVALMKSYFCCLRKMLDNPDTNVNCVDDQGRTLVSNSIIALNNENFNHVSFLLKEKKADPNIADVKGLTAFDHLCSHNLEVLAAGQFKPKMTSEEKETVKADTRNLYKKYFKLFIECGADINHRDTEGLTPIFRAISSANGDGVGYLLDERNIELNIVSKQKLSVLHFLDKLVGSSGYVVIADKILKKSNKAELINLYSNQGYTPVLAAFEQYMNLLPGQRATIYARLEQELKEKRFAQAGGKKEKAKKGSKLDEEGGDDGDEDDGENEDDSDGGDDDSEDRPRKKKSKKYPGMKGGARMWDKYQGKVAMKKARRYPGQYMGSEETNLAANIALTSEEIAGLEKEADLEFKDKIGEFLEFLRLMQKNGANLNLLIKNPKKVKESGLKEDEEEKNDEDDPDYFTENYFRILEDLLDRQVKAKFNLQKKAKVSVKVGYSLMHLACKAVNKDVIAALVGEFKIPLNQKSVYGESELHCFIAKVAESEENLKIFESLIQRGANVEAKDLKCTTPLLLSVKNNKAQFIKLLLKYKALINAQDTEGNYPLLQAVKNRQLQNVITLAENGANPNIQDENGRSCMHWAINYSQSDADASNEIENTLVNNVIIPGDMNLVDSRGRTPLHYAFIKVGDPFAFTNIDPIETVSNIISRPNVKIDLRDSWGNTPLHYAAQRGSVISALYLMKNGADFNALNDDGNSPLNVCLICGHQNMAIFLIQKGVNLKIDIKVRTPTQKRAELEKKKQEEAKDGEENSEEEADEEYDEEGELIVRKRARKRAMKNRRNIPEEKEEAEYESSESLLEEEAPEENVEEGIAPSTNYGFAGQKRSKMATSYGGGFGGMEVSTLVEVSEEALTTTLLSVARSVEGQASPTTTPIRYSERRNRPVQPSAWPSDETGRAWPS
jgi:ankyrin repeat protein